MSASYSVAAAAVIESKLGSQPPLDRAPRAQLAGQPARGGDYQALILRNAGGKPLRFHAELLAEGSSRGTDAACWHEVALYRTQGGQVAMALRFLRPAGAETGVHRARLFEDMNDAATYLERFDPACDLTADFDVSDPRLSAACVVLKAACLRDRAERLNRAFRSLIGEVLFQLETEL